MTRKAKIWCGIGVFVIAAAILNAVENFGYFASGKLPEWSIDKLASGETLPGAVRLAAHQQRYSQAFFSFQSNRFIREDARPDTQVDAVYVPLVPDAPSAQPLRRMVVLKTTNYTQVKDIPARDRSVLSMDVSVSYKEAIPDDVVSLLVKEYPQYSKDQFVVLDQSTPLPSPAVVLIMLAMGGACFIPALRGRALKTAYAG
jgi:hypothetical protein